MAIAAPSDFLFVVKTPYSGILTWVNNDEYQYIEIWENRAGVGYGAIPKYIVMGHKESHLTGGLDPGINYCYKALGGIFEPPAESAFCVENCKTTYAILADPTDIETTVFSDFIEITWKDNSSAEDAFCVERNDGGWHEIAVVDANVEYWRDTTVAVGVAYTYRVRAREVGPNYSGYVTGVAVTANNIPDDPTGATISGVTDEEMRVTWVAPAAGFEVTGYKVQIDDNGAFPTPTEYIVAADVLTFLFKDLTPSQQYWVRVCSYNGVGDSAGFSADDDTCPAQYVRTEFEVFVRDPNVEPVYIAELDLKMDLSGFAPTAGEAPVYDIEIDERGLEIDSVWEDGVALTEKASIAQVKATASTWWWDTSIRKLYVHTSTSTNPDGSDCLFMEGGFIHRIPSRDFQYADAVGCTLPPWLSASGIPAVTQENRPYFRSSFRLSTGSISFINALSAGDYYFDTRFETFTWIGAKVTIYCGEESFNLLTKFSKMFSAYITNKEMVDGKITLALRDTRKELERDLILDRYWIADYIDLPEDFEGREKVKAYGFIDRVAPVPIEGYSADENASAKFSYHDGRSMNVGQVLVNDVIKDEGTDYATPGDYYVDLQRSIITFARDIVIGEDDVVRISFTGVVDSADEPVNNGAEAFKHILNNEAVIPTTKLNTDWIYETKYANTRLFSTIFNADISYDEILRTIEHTTEAYILQDGDARLGLRPLQAVVPSKAKYIWNFQSKHHKQRKDRNSLYWKVRVHYKEDPQLTTWEFVDGTDDGIKSKFGVEKMLSVYTYFRDPVNAEALVTSILSLINKTYIEDTLSTILFDAFPGDLIKFSRTRFFNSDGTADELTMRLIRIEKNPESASTTVAMERVP